jgi:chromosome segregation ATPase
VSASHEDERIADLTELLDATVTDLRACREQLVAREAELAEVKADLEACAAHNREWCERFNRAHEMHTAMAGRAAQAEQRVSHFADVIAKEREARQQAEQQAAALTAKVAELEGERDELRTLASLATGERMKAERWEGNQQTHAAALSQELALVREALEDARPHVGFAHQYDLDYSRENAPKSGEVLARIDAALARAPQEGATQPTEGPTL